MTSNSSNPTPGALNPDEQALVHLVDPVHVYPGATPWGSGDQFGPGLSEHQVKLDRSFRAAASIAEVYAWYRDEYPDASGGSPLVDGHAIVFLAPRLSPTDLSALAQPWLEVDLAGTDTDSAITIRASGYPVGARTPDTLIPEDDIVSATVTWTVEDPQPSAAQHRDLTAAEIHELVDFLNAAPTKPPMQYGGLMYGTLWTLTFVASDGATYTARYDNHNPISPTVLDFGTESSRLLDLPPAYYAALARMTTG
ncbi:hypothetical protein GIS00_02420 [Nakamurella sp. YIM 132087]|uniref:Uncharacterized protein n=1 Tax=Nakamurella alba TaxID=2665158 RepID=A0A7K1FH61_9ACTN|nr:hypothetical protein [Nakamurella alba]MTD12799.1 hypothetical protein [Nakamurella alba]